MTGRFLICCTVLLTACAGAPVQPGEAGSPASIATVPMDESALSMASEGAVPAARPAPNPLQWISPRPAARTLAVETLPPKLESLPSAYAPNSQTLPPPAPVAWTAPAAPPARVIPVQSLPPALAPVSIRNEPRVQRVAQPLNLPPPDAVLPAAAASGPVALGSGSQLGAGDVLTINVLGQPELTTTADVDGSGRVNIPLAGTVIVAGLSTTQAAARIAKAFQEGEYLVDPQVTVNVAESRSQQISVLGEVRQPGRFKVQSRTTVLDGLALAGGVAETGASSAYVLRNERGSVVRYELDLEALLAAGRGQTYFDLLPGDSIIVPKAELFYIYGEVRAPNAYKLKPGMTVMQALSMAGGLTDKGSDKRLEVRRRDGSGALGQQAVSLTDAVQADDVLYVKERFF